MTSPTYQAVAPLKTEARMEGGVMKPVYSPRPFLRQRW